MLLALPLNPNGSLQTCKLCELMPWSGKQRLASGLLNWWSQSKIHIPTSDAMRCYWILPAPPGFFLFYPTSFEDFVQLQIASIKGQALSFVNGQCPCQLQRHLSSLLPRWTRILICMVLNIRFEGGHPQQQQKKDTFWSSKSRAAYWPWWPNSPLWTKGVMRTRSLPANSTTGYSTPSASSSDFSKATTTPILPFTKGVSLNVSGITTIGLRLGKLKGLSAWVRHLFGKRLLIKSITELPTFNCKTFSVQRLSKAFFMPWPKREA